MGGARWVVASLLAAFFCGSLGWLAAPAKADLSQFEARAAADGVRVGVLAPGASLFDQLADVGIPVSQSVLTGLGTSQAFASMPYPGDVVVNGPATAAALAGTPAPPPYPLIVQSSHPSAPDANFSQPGYELKVHSDAGSSLASSSTGGTTGDSAVASTRADATSRLDGDTLVARAASVSELVNAGGVLRLGQVLATAEASRDKDGHLSRKSDFHVDGLTVAGVTLGIGPDGLALAGSNTPLPADSSLAQILQQAGVTVSYLRPIEDDTGIVSAGLRITQVQQVNGTTVTVTYTLGRASAHAGATAGDTAPSGAVPGEGTSVGPEAPSAVAGSGVAADTGLAGPDLGGSSSPAASTPRTAPAARPSTSPAVLTRTAPVGSRASVYLVMVVAAAVGVGATQLFRVLGVKLAWRF